MKTAAIIPAYNEQERITEAVFSLAIQRGIDEQPLDIVVVDNNSVDQTVEAAQAALTLIRTTPHRLHIINESQQGTGAAADTGFRYAIDELGADVIGRIDADSVAMTYWLAAMQRHFEKRPQTALLTGHVWASTFDNGKYYPLEEFALARVIKPIGTLIKVAQYKSIGMLRFAPGHNMATTALAYDSVEGFPRTSIIEASEDVAYSLKIAREFGIRHMDYDPMMIVRTSNRRIREMGRIGAARYYFSDNSKRRAKLTECNPDYR